MLEKIHNQLPSENHKQLRNKQLPITAVDKLADELVTAYKNPNFKSWYCGVIYEFGPEIIAEWRNRASEGDEPAKLFSKYVSDNRKYHKGNKGKIHVA